MAALMPRLALRLSVPLAAMLLACTGTVEIPEPHAAAGQSKCGPVGRTALARLNRAEYDNTVRDLLGVDIRPAERFPEDDRANVFDNNAALQTMSPMRLEAHLEAAEGLAAKVVEERPARVVSCWPAEESPSVTDDVPPCAREILSALVNRAYRRPATSEEVQSVLEVFRRHSTETFGQALEAAIAAVLVAPQFLFRPVGPAPGGGLRALDDHELATRLSYFLWRTMPDDELRALADAATLHEGDHLAQQVRRMLADTRADQLVRVMTEQWLALRGLAAAAPDRARYAVYYEQDLRPAMEWETRRFVDHLLKHGGSIADLVTAPFTFLDARLARHYGVPAPERADSVRVDLGAHGRRGVLTQASVLTMNTNANRTSVVKRGKWVQSALLCAPLPDPPANVVQQLPAGPTPQNQRERLAQHRQRAECRACHALLDPPGLALEGFDLLGRRRTVDEDGLPVDTSAVLADGGRLTGPHDLADAVVDDPSFAGCVARNLMTYALARELDSQAACAADALAAAAPARQQTLADLIVALTSSAPFLTQAPEAP